MVLTKAKRALKRTLADCYVQFGLSAYNFILFVNYD